MRVKTYVTVNEDIDVEVDVDVNEILMEFSRRMEQCELNSQLPPYKYLSLPLVDFATRLMSSIPAKAISGYKDSQRAEVAKRLATELERWNGIMITVD